MFGLLTVASLNLLLAGFSANQDTSAGMISFQSTPYCTWWRSNEAFHATWLGCGSNVHWSCSAKPRSRDKRLELSPELIYRPSSDQWIKLCVNLGNTGAMLIKVTVSEQAVIHLFQLCNLLPTERSIPEIHHTWHCLHVELHSSHIATSSEVHVRLTISTRAEESNEEARADVGSSEVEERFTIYI